MYRAVVLTTLVLLLLAVAGVSVAQDGRIFAGQPNSGDPPEATTLERTSLEATGSEVTTTSQPPGAFSETEDHQNIPEPTVEEPEKSIAAPAREETPTPAANEVGKPGDGGRAVGKPEPAVKASDPAAGSAEMGQHGNGKPEELGDEEGLGRSVGGQIKVTLCHKANKTLTVGVPALLAAHRRHRDSLGACQGGVSGPEPSDETMGPEAGINGEGGGRDKVVLCHKNKTLTVGAPAQTAHLRHGDSLRACP